MKNGPNSYHALVGIHRTAVAVSALTILLSVSSVYAADPPVPRGNVSVNINPTTSYYTVTNSTLRLPNGVSVSPSAASVPVVSKYSGGLQQSIPAGITIDAIKKSAPLSAVVRSTTQSVKGAATRCLTSARCNVGLILAGEGLDRLFDGLDWVMGEGGKIQKKAYHPDDIPVYNQNNVPPDVSARNGGCNDFGESCIFIYSGQGAFGGTADYGCRPALSTRVFAGYIPSPTRQAPSCLYTRNPEFYAEETTRPVSDTDIASGVESSYVPEPSDWPALTPEMNPDDIEITWAPTLEGEPVTTTIFDADGNPYKVTETNIWYDFDIRDNPSPRPALDMKTREETKTYEDGVLTSTTTTNSTASAGSSDTPPPAPESLIDCDLFPTACAWFDWTQEEPIEPDDDLSGLLQEVPIVSETFTITGGVAACPAPMVLDLSVFGSREVSYQPLCDLASTMKYLYLALMSFAAAVLLNRSVNRV